MPVHAPESRSSLTDRLSHAVRSTAAAERTRATVAELRGRAVPLHWSNLFGVVAMACIVVLFVTGVFLTFFYTPSSEPVVYSGSYAPLRGVEMSKALESTLFLSFEVPGGLLMRQAHHWAGLLLPAALIMQLLVTFFTGAFRRPRQWSWVLLFLVFLMALLAGWSGYALPDDLLSGTGLRIVEGIVLGIPVVGTWLSALLFGGEFPGQIIEHLAPVHILIAPAGLVLFLALRIRLAFRHGPAQFAGPGRTEGNAVGLPLLPQLAVRAGALFLIVVGLILGFAATVTVAPVWLFGPSSPADASAGSQPDWYTGFLDGALRLVPPGWEVEWFSRTWTLAVIVPLLVVGVFLALVAVYPFLEAWITGDRREHHLLDRPRNAPGRTGIGVAAIVFYGALWGAASADLIATHFQVGLEATIWMFRVLVVAGPLVGFDVARRVCLALQRKDRELVLHGYETGRIVRLPGGEYAEVHAPLTEEERWRLIDRGTAPERPRGSRIRGALFGLFFEDRLAAPPRPPLPE
ncbi:cytochrome bc1 complex cytochrome b subunit [Agromyces larvae]|uniref:Cytochrome bc1 complex cytochrome b subunit n=1 Tax=Agromyces larvae TaxID=2929802 RepID=A0ABY4C1F8_9MICO|nr:cytochrome b N-terminal domain-containing protein [Agromyces larvae]UOE44282.1 cytochrome b N-terminal domain-containing protein [Agromyces larvae]